MQADTWAIARDGKVLRGSHNEHGELTLFSALLHDQGLVLGQVRVPPTTTETTCVPALVGPMDLTGALVTADATHTCAATADYLVQVKKADYLLCVKGNQDQLQRVVIDRVLDLAGQAYSKQIALMVSSRPMDAVAFHHHARSHRHVENLEHYVRDVCWAEDTLGSGPVIGVVRSQLETVEELGRHARAGVQDDLVSLTAQYDHFMAWLCSDQGDKAAALAWFDRSHSWALGAGHANMAATTLSMKAHIAWSVGDGPRCVRPAQAARRHEGHVSPGIGGMAFQMQARRHALLGEQDSARAQLDQAEQLIRGAEEHPEDEPD